MGYVFKKGYMVKKIALIGASSTGKTTVYELLKSKLPKYEFINESTRTVKEFGFPINEQGTSETQLAISSFHLEALLKPYNCVLDRCYMDLVVYTKYMNKASAATVAFIDDTWSRIKNEYSHYVYFPIEFKSVDDGVRSINEEWRRDIDKEFRNQLASINSNMIKVTGSPMQRVEQILEFIK